MSAPPELSRRQTQPLIDAALAEDLGGAGDLTTDAVVPATQGASGLLVARQPGCIAGLEVARWVFETLDPGIDWRPVVADGDEVPAGATLARVGGSARALLTGERVALNLLGRMSGIASATRRMVRLAAPAGATVVCTRKTTPGLRRLEKYAVRAGGGRNHRFGLDDAILIKDNHIAIAGGVTAAIAACRDHAGHLVKIEVEVDDLQQLDEALAAKVDVVMLDNFELGDLEQAVARARERGVVTEASGGVSLETIGSIAATGVDLISVGWLTHSAPALDVALDI